jgi:hypothetical protein
VPPVRRRLPTAPTAGANSGVKLQLLGGRLLRVRADLVLTPPRRCASERMVSARPGRFTERRVRTLIRTRRWRCSVLAPSTEREISRRQRRCRPLRDAADLLAAVAPGCAGEASAYRCLRLGDCAGREDRTKTSSVVSGVSTASAAAWSDCLWAAARYRKASALCSRVSPRAKATKNSARQMSRFVCSSSSVLERVICPPGPRRRPLRSWDLHVDGGRVDAVHPR